MAFGTSFFNKTIYKKTLLRCWPLWLMYIGVWLVALPMGLISPLTDNRLGVAQYHVLESATIAGPIIAFFACGAVAMAVFGWLYNTRSTGFGASLPVSRSSHYFTALAAGLTLLLGSNVFIFLCTALVELLYGHLDMLTLWQWLGWTCLLDIHFLGFAACCAMLTGHLAILPAVYAIFQLAVVTIQGTAAYILEHILWGMDYGRWTLAWLSPLWSLPGYHQNTVYDPATGLELRTVLTDWHILFAYAAAGVLLAGLGWWLFRRRRMETATDVVAIPILKPVFRWCLALAFSLGFGGLLVTIVYANHSGGGNMGEALIILAVVALGGLIGWFLADVLMAKTIRVFHLHWKGAVVYTALLAAVVLGAELDVTGYEKKLPDPAAVEEVYLYTYDGYLTLDEPENLARILALNESIIQNRNFHEQNTPTDGWYYHVSINYRGSPDDTGEREPLLSRSYMLLITDEQAADPQSDIRQLEAILNSKEAIGERKETRIPVTPDTIFSARITGEYESQTGEYFYMDLTPEEAYELYTQCILPDLADGTLGRVWPVADETYEKSVYNLRIALELQQLRPDWTGSVETPLPVSKEAPPTYEQVTEAPYSYDYFYTVPTVDSHRTNAWLQAHGVPLETLWEVWNQTK